MDIELRENATRDDVLQFIEAVLAGEFNLNANLANLAALLNQYLPDINWVGFYLFEHRSQDWVLGPFAGKPACTRIGHERGVVGQALSRGKTLVVPNVLEFEGHIACDGDSRSEVVIPIFSEGHVVAGLDVDSPHYDRFKTEDVQLMEELCHNLGDHWSRYHWY